MTEPDPAGGSDFVTTYTYDSLGHLFTVSMPRPTGTQTRTFVYSGNQLTSATNPENGTVTYNYNSDKTLAKTTDAKGQITEYSYDAYKRVTQMRRGAWGNLPHTMSLGSPDRLARAGPSEGSGSRWMPRDTCGPQKINRSSRCLLLQPIFVVQPAEKGNGNHSVPGGELLPADAGRNLGLGWLRNSRS